MKPSDVCSCGHTVEDHEIDPGLPDVPEVDVDEPRPNDDRASRRRPWKVADR